MTKPHPLAEVLIQADDIYHSLRAYALAHQLVEHDFEGYQMLASLRQSLNQSTGIVEAFERDVIRRSKR